MSYVIVLDPDRTVDPARVGHKAHAVAGLMRAPGWRVPVSACVTVDAYRDYLRETGLDALIELELGRKAFAQMRWEELWDAATRIRHRFAVTPLPAALEAAVWEPLEAAFGRAALVVRSSAPGEDGRETSFAGLHESFVNVRGRGAVLSHLRLVWASLWSDAALLYRQEIGLDVARSAMAVLVQRIVDGERSGVVFTLSPQNPDQAVVEAVHGLNQGLVDGTIHPDRWLIDRQRRNVAIHTPASREQWMVRAPRGVRLERLSAERAARAPLTDDEALAVFDAAEGLARDRRHPQDVEWTLQGDDLYLLQARPVTTAPDGASGGDQAGSRAWYLSLRRSYDNLKALQEEIEARLIPALQHDAADLAAVVPEALDAGALGDHLRRCVERQRHWSAVYQSHFIPFAHGMRLFGQIYNDRLNPADPYEFVDLLSAGTTLGVQRNREMAALADLLRADAALCEQVRRDPQTLPGGEFGRRVTPFLERHSAVDATPGSPRILLQVLLHMALAPPPVADRRLDAETRRRRLEAAYRDAFAEDPHHADQLLALGRASYRLRDDDNVYMERLTAPLQRAVSAAEARLTASDGSLADAHHDLAGLVAGARDTLSRRSVGFIAGEAAPSPPSEPWLRARQLRGQPAGTGIGRGAARVVVAPADLAAFRKGEVLVCDAVDPAMTVVVPLAAAVVERRGGMLIHGAIIAREYGLACVTGVPDATGLIRTGDRLIVDGYLGIVTIDATDQGTVGNAPAVSRVP